MVIVTYNGSERLEQTLIHLSKQKSIDFNIEILLIDNNSTDDTAKKAASLWETLNACFEIRIVSELQPGTMFARKRGIQEAKYRYMLYCDDDNWLNPNYVSIAYSCISKNEDIAALGGRGIMEHEKGFKAPFWIEDYQSSYGAGNQGRETGDITHGKGCLYTAGTILDLKWLDKLYQLGFVSSLKGRDSKTLVAGEDTELTYALKVIGGKLYYNSEMHFKHFMPSGRINWQYLKKLWWAFGYSDQVISPYIYFFSKRKIPKRFFYDSKYHKGFTLFDY